MSGKIADRFSWLINELEKRLGINTTLGASPSEVEIVRKYDELVASRFPDDAGRVLFTNSRRYKLTNNSVWFVKQPGGVALAKMRIKHLTPCTVVLTGTEIGFFETTYSLADITFVEPVSIEPPKLNDVYLEITCNCPPSDKITKAGYDRDAC